jgi:hypothetical protein
MKELQDLDCNCNNCKFMVRDLDKFQKWKEWRKSIQLQDFERRKAHAIKIAITPQELNKALKMTFQFDGSGMFNYGDCNKFNKPVSFLPNTFSFETQKCFIHRNN